MKKVLDSLCDYRRFSWNLGLETWQNMHEARQLALTQHLKAELKKPRKNKSLQTLKEKFSQTILSLPGAEFVMS
jgi:transposase, IS605 orfB family protein